MKSPQEPSTESKPSLVGSIPAQTLAALAPMIRACEAYRTSPEAFMTQKNVHVMGTYLIPVAAGAVLLATDGMRMVGLYDPEARVATACKLWLADDLLTAAIGQTVALADVNGYPFTVPMRPRPGHLIFFPQFAILSLRHEDVPLVYPEWQEGDGDAPALGTWTDRSHGNGIDTSNFHVEAADRAFVQAIRTKFQDCPTRATTALWMHPAILHEVMQVAVAVDAQPLHLSLTGADGMVTLTSPANLAFWAVVMPCKLTDEGIKPVNEISGSWREALAHGETEE